MNWQDLINGNKTFSMQELMAMQEAELRLFNYLAKKEQQRMENSFSNQAKPYGTFDKLPFIVKKQMLNDMSQWEQKWGAKSDTIKEVHDKYDRLMDSEMVNMHSHYSRSGELKENSKDMIDTKFHEDLSSIKLKQNYKEASTSITNAGNEAFAQPKDDFLKEMREAKERTKQNTIERHF